MVEDADRAGRAGPPGPVPPRVHLAAPEGYDGPRRALILPGGGMRLSYQAGVLRALAEAGIVFTHADGTSGGSLNLAMLLSGLSPVEMCDRWRRLNMMRTVSLRPLREYVDVLELTAIADGDGLLRDTFPSLGIDFQKVRRAEGLEALFNVYNFTRKANEVIPAREMDRELLLAGMSLAGLLPPVLRNGDRYLDSGFLRDASPVEMVRRGAQELWVIWGMGDIPEFRGGPVDLYVQVLEMSAVGALHEDIDHLREINERIAAGETVFGHREPIRLHLVRPDRPLPLDTELYLGRVSHGALVDQGYADARRYLATMSPGGLPLEHGVTRMESGARGITFHEVMSGGFALGATTPDEGRRLGDAGGTTLAMHATVAIPDLDRFTDDPEHPGELTGHVDFAPLGLGLPASRGVFSLFRPTDQPGLKLMVYELAFEANGRPYYLAGRKEVRSDTGVDLWRDTTTLLTTLHEGADAGGPVVGAGVLTLGVDDLARLATTVRVTGPGSHAEKAATVAAFGGFFMGELWDTYARPPSRLAGVAERVRTALRRLRGRLPGGQRYR